MFTGLIQKTGRLAAIEPRGQGARLRVEHPGWDEPLQPGESIAVQGVCLTAAEIGQGMFACDVLKETLDRTNLGTAGRGAILNLERSLRPSDRLGGHFVTGHVDGIGTVRRISNESEDWVLEIACGNELLSGICEKGSVACDGVSLTVAGVTATSFDMRLIPFTRENTSLSSLTRGCAVNIETDILAKYVRLYLSPPGGKEISIERLRESGFLG